MPDGSNSDKVICALVHATDRANTLLARRLHDSLAQNLAAASMTLSMLEHAKSASRAELVRECEKLIDLCITEVRDTCFRLSPPLAGKAALPRAMQCLAETLEKQLGVPVRVNFAGAERADEEVEAGLLRILHDATRALVGAGAPAIDVEAYMADGSYNIVLRGKCELHHDENQRVLECILKARAQNCGALLSVFTHPGGTDIRVASSVPVLL